MLRKWMSAGILAAVAFASSAHATTVSLNPDGNWNIFDIDELTAESAGLEWIDIFDGSALSFTISATTDLLLTVVDGAFAGDRFQLFDNGNLLGVTGSATSSYPDSLGLDFDAALADGRYSTAVFQLAAGNHVITGNLLQSLLIDGEPVNATVGALKVSEVPLPGGLLLLLSGGGVLGALRRRSHGKMEAQS